MTTERVSTREALEGSSGRPTVAKAIDAAVDIAIVGAGIVGLATARELLQRTPGLRLVVLEREDAIARQQTGHNSGVIHSGIYYAPGSLRARFCVAGAADLMRYCDQRGIEYQRCGKMIVATDEAELPRLNTLYERGVANGVPGLELIDPAQLREIEPHARGIRALWSPATGIVDFTRVAAAYAEDVWQAGGEIHTGAGVESIRVGTASVLLTTQRGVIEARRVVTCAGLQADRVARLTGASPEPRIVPFRGDYYRLRADRRHLVRTNIYPVPDPRFPFLGVHFTPRTNGEIWLGPNAVLAFSRNGYHFTDISPRDLWEIFSYRGFQRFARTHWRTGLDEMARDLSKRRFLQSLQRYLPELELADLEPGPSGVRAQALSPAGALVDDFVIDRTERILHVRNAPSPAATSSLAIGSYIADALDEIA